MRFKWDEAKRQANLREHGIDFETVAEENVFEGEIATLVDDRFDYGETRFFTLALLRGRVIAISHTETEL